MNHIQRGEFSYSRKQDFFDWYANDYIKIGPFKISMAEIWLQHKDRRQYQGVEFAIDNARPNFFNLWEGFAVQASERGQCNLFFEFLRDVICSGDAKLYKWLTQWFAHIVQRAQEKGGIAVVLRGLRGTGKTLVGEIFKKLLPKNAIILSSPDELLGVFNAHLQCALFVQVEEAFWAGNRQAEGKLKTLITSETIGIHPKFINRFEVRNYSRFLITSNEEWVVPAGFHERRFTVIDVNRTHMQDHDYFAAILAQLEADNGSGYERLMWELQRIDLSDFNCRKHYHTEALEDQIRESFSPLQRFVCHMLETGNVPSVPDNPAQTKPWDCCDKGNCVDCDDFFKDYQRYERQFSRFPIDSRAFGKRLKKLIPGIKHMRTGSREARKYVYEFPDLAACREAFAKENAITLDEDAETIEEELPF
jgi:phage/plasmid-associated DNA primase